MGDEKWYTSCDMDKKELTDILERCRKDISREIDEVRSLPPGDEKRSRTAKLDRHLDMFARLNCRLIGKEPVTTSRNSNGVYTIASAQGRPVLTVQGEALSRLGVEIGDRVLLVWDGRTISVLPVFSDGEEE